ncbi:MAG: flagellar hook-length control protein FliK [Lachnospiraceae bacterium]|nr:flagellar hook-length control protein FliK [Lachnospiraceae bacterium]
MSFLSGIFTHTGQSNQSPGISAEVVSTDASGNKTVSLQNFSAGQTFRGEIISLKGSEVSLQLEDGSFLQARLNQGMKLQVGQDMLFQVRNLSNSQLSLSPLMENISTDETVLKALNEAGLPVTDKTASFVSSMMENGMSIQKNSLLEMSRLVETYPNTDAEILVQMKNIDLPIDSANVELYENFLNLKSAMTETVLDLTKGLQSTFTEIMSEQGTGESLSFYNRVIQMLTDDMNGTDSMQNTLSSAETEVMQGGNTVTEAETMSTGSVVTEAGIMSSGSDATEAGIMSSGSDATEAGITQSVDTADNGEIVKSQPVGNMLELTPDETITLQHQLKQLGSAFEAIADDPGSLTPKHFLQAVKQAITDMPQLARGELQAELVKLFSSREFGKVMENEMLNQWTVTPGQLSKENVAKLLNRIREQSNQLEQILQQSGKSQGTLAKSVNSVQNNTSFMQSMNHLMGYVQVPLSMVDKKGAGQLYVYSRKKSLASETDQVTALLHLDMEHLGPLDIYVSIKNMDVKTKFYFQNDSILDFMEANMHILDERLQKRGYHLEHSMELQKDGNTIVKEATGGAEKHLLSRHAFDVRT